jgi:hypothetical protein
MQTLKQYKEWYAKASRDSMIQEIFKLSHANAKLENRQKVIDWNIEIQKSLEIENLKTEIIHLKTEIIHLKEKLATPYNPDVVTTPRTDMLACQNPYMIEEHTKKKNNASEST